MFAQSRTCRARLSDSTLCFVRSWYTRQVIVDRWAPLILMLAANLLLDSSIESLRANEQRSLRFRLDLQRNPGGTMLEVTENQTLREFAWIWWDAG
jgi:hypothetical protein